MLKAKSNRSPGRPRQNEQKQPTNEIILHSASQLFLEKGFQEVSVDDVAEHCDVTKATVYYYFGSKAELFKETMVQMMLHIRMQMDRLLQEDLPLYDRLKNLAITHFAAVQEIDMDSFTRDMRNALNDQQLQKVHEAEEQMYETLAQAFMTAMEQGEVRSTNAHFAAHAFLSILKVGHARDANQKMIFDTNEQAATHIVDLFWDGLSDRP